MSGQPTSAAPCRRCRRCRIHLTRARASVIRLLARPGAAAEHHVIRATRALARLSPTEVRQLAGEHGLVARGGGLRLPERVAAQAVRVLTTREQWARAARQAGVRPAELFERARALHELDREHCRLVCRMLREARQLYRAQTGHPLTRNHPAFRGGDPACLPGFEAVARTLAGRYPELLGAHGYGGSGESDIAARRLYDLLAAGAPPVPRRADSYAQALEELQGQVRPPSADSDVPF